MILEDKKQLSYCWYTYNALRHEKKIWRFRRVRNKGGDTAVTIMHGSGTQHLMKCQYDLPGE